MPDTTAPTAEHIWLNWLIDGSRAAAHYAAEDELADAERALRDAWTGLHQLRRSRWERAHA